MDKILISTDEAFLSKSPLTQAVRAGNIIFVSGQVPVDSKTMTVVSEDFSTQVRHVLNSLTSIIKKAGFTLQDISKTTVFLTDMSHFEEMNEIYKEYFPKNPPARTCIGVKALPRQSQIEVEAIAVVD